MQIWISAVRISWDPSFAQLQPFLLFSATVSATVRCEGKSRDKERHSLPWLVTCLTPARHPPSNDSLDTQHLGSHATQASHQHGKDPAWDHTALRWGGANFVLAFIPNHTTSNQTQEQWLENLPHGKLPERSGNWDISERTEWQTGRKGVSPTKENYLQHELRPG